MLAFLRRVFVGSWLGRILAILIFLSFAAWGMGGFFADLVGGGGIGAGNVASVGGQQITATAFERTYRHGLASAAQNQRLSDPNALPYGQRRQIAATALQQLIFEAAITHAANRIGVVVPDSVVRTEVLNEKAFAGPDGKFNRSLFDQKLQNAGFTEDQLAALLRGQLQATGLVEPVRIGGYAPAELVKRAFAFDAEQRVLDMVTVPFPSQPPAAPDEAVLRRTYDNNRDVFTAPEYRRIKLVLLSPATIARDAQVSEADERQAYEQLITRYQVPEKRSVQIMILPDQARATALAATWRAGASWAKLQAGAPDATPVTLDDASQASIPSPDLAKLVFAAPVGTVTGPDKTEAGWVVMQVSKVTPANDRSFDQVRDELREMIGAQRAASMLAPRVQKLQDAIAGGGLDAIPADLGAQAAEGTLDAQGMTPTGDPAPLPGSDAVRKAEIARAFSIGKGQAPVLTQGPEESWFAVVVEDITPAAPLAFVQAADKVRAFWQQQQQRRTAETAAADLLHQAQGAHGLAAVASTRPGFATTYPGFASGLVVRRGQQGGPVPANMAQLAFSLKQGESTMLEIPDGFVVATLTAIRHPDPAADKVNYDRLRYSLDTAIADDLENTYVSALRDRAKPQIDNKALDAVVGPPDAGGRDSGSPS